MQGERSTMASNAPEYLDIMASVWPLALAGIAAAMALNLKKAMKEATAKDRIASLLITSIPSAVVAVGAVLLLPLLLSDASKVTPALEMGIAVVCGGLGTKVFDMWLRAKFNLIIREKEDGDEE